MDKNAQHLQACVRKREQQGEVAKATFDVIADGHRPDITDGAARGEEGDGVKTPRRAPLPELPAQTPSRSSVPLAQTAGARNQGLPE